jgi:hypothetical protein
LELESEAGKPNWNRLRQAELLALRVSEQPSLAAAVLAITVRQSIASVFLTQLAKVPDDLLAEAATRGLAVEQPLDTLRRGIIQEIAFLEVLERHPASGPSAENLLSEELYAWEAKEPREVFGLPPISTVGSLTQPFEHHGERAEAWFFCTESWVAENAAEARLELIRYLADMRPGGHSKFVPTSGIFNPIRGAYLPSQTINLLFQHIPGGRADSSLERQQSLDSLRLISAAELLRRQSGEWPTDVSQLPPMPLDPATGAAYRLTPGENGVLIHGDRGFEFCWPPRVWKTMMAKGRE